MNESATISADVPTGFRPIRIPGGFVGVNGPLHGRLQDGCLHLGFRVEERHLNAAMMCHGGMLMMVADLQLAVAAVVQSSVGPFLPTINLSVDFVAPAHAGDWVHGQTEVVKTTRSLTFAQGSLMIDGSTILRA
ncbi:MAG TPA: PaaI family thioesterase, partial [Alphaproteobacteria bacterium]|nr:PaaI family thioesterase [Alphaproteobacteria bacterium]